MTWADDGRATSQYAFVRPIRSMAADSATFSRSRSCSSTSRTRSTEWLRASATGLGDDFSLTPPSRRPLQPAQTCHVAKADMAVNLDRTQ